MRWIAGVLVAVSLGALAAFTTSFNPYRHQPAVDALLLAALAGLSVGALLAARPPARRLPAPAWADVAVVAAMNAALCVLWLPHWDNWRWAYTGDSVAWYGPALAAASGGLERNLLSMRGVDFHFTYLHSLGFNSLMFVFEPTFFWHRVGKMIVSGLSLTAVWVFFRVAVGRWWALLIAFAVAVNFYLVRMSYVSYGHIDSLFFCFNALTLTALLWRRSDDRRLWLLAGLNAGLALYFTQTAWTGVGAAGLLLAGLATRRRRLADLGWCGAVFAVCALPIALQWRDFLHLISSQTKPSFAWGYLSDMLVTIFSLPYDSTILHKRGMAGGFLRPPLGHAYAAGVVLAAVALWPAARRRLRLPAATPLLAALLAVEVVLLTVMNNGYLEPSANRIYHLIPLQLFFACLPFAAVAGVLRDTPMARAGQALAVALAVGAVGLYAQRNLAILVHPPDFLFGSKTTDGFIELRQRHPDKQALYLVGSEPEIADYNPGSFFDEVYGVADTVTAVASVSARMVDEACARGSLVCCHAGAPCGSLAGIVQELAPTWSFALYPTVNSRSLECLECRPTADTAGSDN
jgi:hypothetical protein